MQTRVSAAQICIKSCPVIELQIRIVVCGCCDAWHVNWHLLLAVVLLVAPAPAVMYAV